VPAFADPDTHAAVQQAAHDYLSDIGFSREEMIVLYEGSVLRDARIQTIILDGARYRRAQNAANTAMHKPGLPVQRPGVSQPRLDPKLVELDS